MNVRMIPLEKIIPPETVLRRQHETETIYELAESIRSVGLINALTVKPAGEFFEIVSGHRRFLAMQFLQALTAPCNVIERHDGSEHAIKIHENIYRKDLTPLEEAREVTRLREREGLPFTTIALIFKKSVGWVRDRYEFDQYPEGLKEVVHDGKVSFGVAKILSQIDDAAALEWHVRQAEVNGCTIAMAQVWVDNYRAAPWKLPTPEEIAELKAKHKPPPIPRVSCTACYIMMPLDTVTQAYLCPTCATLFNRIGRAEREERETNQNAT